VTEEWFPRVERIAERTEEIIVVTTAAPRVRECPAWVVLGIKAVGARDVRAA
jgi:hypothetical protein